MTPSATDARAAAAVAALLARGLTVATAESLTGGWVCTALTSVPGSSAVVRGAVVSYATDLKSRLLGVDTSLLARVGPVHADVAAAMARGVVDRLEADVGVACTGVAGPDPQGGRPPGTVFVARYLAPLGAEPSLVVRAATFAGDRRDVREATVLAVLDLLAELAPG